MVCLGYQLCAGIPSDQHFSSSRILFSSRIEIVQLNSLSNWDFPIGITQQKLDENSYVINKFKIYLKQVSQRLKSVAGG